MQMSIRIKFLWKSEVEGGIMTSCCVFAEIRLFYCNMSRTVGILHFLLARNEDDALLIFRSDEFIGSIVFYALSYVQFDCLYFIVHPSSCCNQ